MKVFYKRKQQEKNVLKVHIRGLSQAWDKSTTPFEELIASLNETLSLDIINLATMSWVSNKTQLFIGNQILNGQAILRFLDKEHHQHPLQQSCLLKDTNFWIAEELSPTQLKRKGEQLKKILPAQEAGKWAIYRGGKAMIQEFHNPKLGHPCIDTPTIH